MKKRTNNIYTTEFKQEAVVLVTEQGYTEEIGKPSCFDKN